jgi:hypothetical protein
MSDLAQPDLTGVMEHLAQIDDDAPLCPIAASLAYDHIFSSPGLQMFVLSQIAANDAEPWAQQVAKDWLRDNQV